MGSALMGPLQSSCLSTEGVVDRSRPEEQRVQGAKEELDDALEDAQQEPADGVGDPQTPTREIWCF